MAREVNRGEIWFYTFRPPDKRRPVLVLTRQVVISLLRTVMVAPVTSTIRGAPGESGESQPAWVIQATHSLLYAAGYQALEMTHSELAGLDDSLDAAINEAARKYLPC